MGGTLEWNTERFATLVNQGDPVADEVVQRLFEERALPGVQLLLNGLTRNDGTLSPELPDYVRNYFATLPVTEVDLARVVAGEAVFAQHGPEIMMVLCCASLPFDYANARGVEVLDKTGFLAKQPNLRVAQTAQMIVDVLAPGGLGPEGYGIRSTQKVRLMHAAIRCLLMTDERAPWDRSTYGVPINQLQLLYTLMSFTHVVLAGLKRLGLQLSPQEEQSYLDVWAIVGRILGIDTSLIPTTLTEAKELTEALSLEAQASSPQGRQLAGSLLVLIGDVLGPLRCLRYSLVRYFTGPEVASLLSLPSKPLLDWLVGGVAWLTRTVDDFRKGSAGRQLAFRWLTLRLIQYLIDEQVGLPRRVFEVPSRVHADWKNQSRSAA